MERFLKQCHLAQVPVEIMYLSKNGSISQRTITIREMKGSIVAAYCHLRNTTRNFKIDNILSVNYRKAIRRETIA